MTIQKYASWNLSTACHFFRSVTGIIIVNNTDFNLFIQTENVKNPQTSPFPLKSRRDISLTKYLNFSSPCMVIQNLLWQQPETAHLVLLCVVSEGSPDRD